MTAGVQVFKMKVFNALILFLVAVANHVIDAAHWALIVAGAKGIQSHLSIERN